VFIGSNSTLIAPINIGDHGFVGAGSTLSQDVSAASLAVGRSKQRNIQGWIRPKKNNEDS
jgi:bifunctional UDP-N-acetylglucosamine pyrophosphorylase/glucosamine-1-phosphate N-acetyltransferase